MDIEEAYDEFHKEYNHLISSEEIVCVGIGNDELFVYFRTKKQSKKFELTEYQGFKIVKRAIGIPKPI